MKKNRLLIIEDDHFLAQLTYQIIAQSFDNIIVTGITGSIREAQKKSRAAIPTFCCSMWSSKTELPSTCYAESIART